MGPGYQTQKENSNVQYEHPIYILYTSAIALAGALIFSLSPK